MQAAHDEEKERLRRRLSWLEGRQRELFEIVASNSSDFEIRRKLEDTEKEQHEIHGLLGRTDSEHRATLQEKRQRILVLRNEELTRLEQEAKALRQRKSEIHSELLPEAKACVASLRRSHQPVTSLRARPRRRARGSSRADRARPRR